MVKQAVRQTYTYYTPDSPQGIVIEDSPLQGRGKAWTLGAYTHPVYPSPLNVRIGDAGLHVWVVISWLRQSDGDADDVLARHGDVLGREDLDVALWFYDKYKDEIDERLAGAA